MALTNPCGWTIGNGLYLNPSTLALNINGYAATSTYTPALHNAGPAPSTLTYTSQFGIYNQVGDTVTFSAQCVVNAFTAGGASGALEFVLPVTAGAFTSAGLVTVQVEGCTLSAGIVSLNGIIVSGASTFSISQNVSAGGAISLPITALAAGAIITASGTYFVS